MPSLNPYLSFKANAREAMEFYQSVLGGDLQVMTFADAGGMGVPPEEQALVMHSMLTTTEGFVLMGSDTPGHIEYVEPRGVQISISGEDEQTLRRYWDGLVSGGAVTMPLDPAPWGGLFGMGQDRFGVDWMVSVNADQPPA